MSIKEKAGSDIGSHTKAGSRDERDPTGIFIVGSSRSGTTLLGSILQSAPEVCRYRAESKLLHRCSSKYGPLTRRRNKARFLTDWKNSRQFRRSGLEAHAADELVAQSDSYPELLRRFMGRVVAAQGCRFWVDSTPTAVYHLEDIRNYFANGYVIHVIRDGRAVAMSLAKLGWTGVGTRSFESGLGYSAILWERAVRAASGGPHLLPGRFLEIYYEDLVSDPSKVVSALSDRLGLKPIDLTAINGKPGDLRKESGRKLSSNSTFGDLGQGISQVAIDRWKKNLTYEQIALVERAVGSTLLAHGYELSMNNAGRWLPDVATVYRRCVLAAKNTILHRTPLSRFSRTPLELNKS